MIRKSGIYLMLMTLVAGAGCVSYTPYGFHKSVHCPVDPPFPPPVRGQVYLFMMNGYDGLELAGMLSLRNRINDAGYAKVYYAQRPDSARFYHEMHKLHRYEPGARFILVGYGSAAEKILPLAFTAARDGLPLDAVVFLDPTAATGDLAEVVGPRNIVIRSHNWQGGGGLCGGETILVPNIGHYSLPTSEPVVQTLIELLTTSASQVKPPSTDYLPYLPLLEKPNPTPRPIDPATQGPPPAEWSFLRGDGPFPNLPRDYWPDCRR